MVGILQSRDNWDNWRKRKSLEALGIRRFVYLDDMKASESEYAARADALFRDVTNAKVAFGSRKRRISQADAIRSTPGRGLVTQRWPRGRRVRTRGRVDSAAD